MKNKGLLIASAGIIGLLLLSGSKGKPEDMGGSSGMAGTGGFSLIALPTGFASGGASDGSSGFSDFSNLPNVVINETNDTPIMENKKASAVASSPYYNASNKVTSFSSTGKVVTGTPIIVNGKQTGVDTGSQSVATMQPTKKAQAVSVSTPAKTTTSPMAKAVLSIKSLFSKNK